MPIEIKTALINSLPALFTAAVALYIAFRKTPAEVQKNNSESRKADSESHKADAEADNIHAQVADRWAEHVLELQTEVKGLRLDISQVRRENETYRIELAERDQIIADLKDWVERLVNQLREHAPSVEPEKYIVHSIKTKPFTRLEDKG